MTDGSNREVSILNAALEFRTLSERAAYLDEACAGDAALRQRVEALLQAHDQAGGFLETAPAGLVFKRTEVADTPLTEKAGDRIGRYKLLQQIGEGGCGVVYMAEQEEPVRRRVALKVIKLGMDTKQVIARFDAERQALALMDHPNIARVFDAGATETGRPYFVMELVRGIQITDYCDQNNVSTEERLKLFIQVCRAIQHAHQKGIIHRDIKPSNILVTVNDGVPVPKVIDFGIAKATGGRLTDQTMFTAFEQFIGTPAYMSPEQAAMTSLDIDTRTDIYSLGVLLYELLTGKTPFDVEELLKAGLDAMRQTIQEKEPPKPSTRLSTMVAGELTTTAKHRHTDAPRLIHVIRGDLDWIVMKALEKDRTRRYDTANGMAMDIQRYLTSEPIVARPPSKLYRFQKSVQRNKLAFAAAAAIAAVLVIGVVASTSEAIRATRAEREQARLRQQAETEAAKSQQVARFLEDMLKGVGPSVALGRDTTMLREIVDKTAERIGTDLKDQPEVEIEIRLTLAQVYRDLQLYEKMEETARETLRLARAHFGEEKLAAADALSQIGRALFFLKDLDEAESLTRQAIAMQRKLRGDGSLQEASALLHLGDILRNQYYRHPEDRSKLDEAESAVRASLAIRSKRLGNDNDAVAWAQYALSLVLQNEGKVTDAETTVREALAVHRKNHGEDHPYVGEDYCALAGTLGAQNRLDEAVADYRKGLDILERTAAQKWEQANAHRGLASILAGQGKPVEAEIHQREALALARKVLGADNAYLTGFIDRLANILRKNGKLAEARPLAEEAVAICQRHPDRVEPGAQGVAFATLRDVLTDLGDTAAVETLGAQQLQYLHTSLPPDDPELANALAEFTLALLVSGKFTDAEPLARECLAIREKKIPDEWRTFNARSLLGGSLLGQKKYAEAEPLLLSGYEGLKQRGDKIPADGRVRLKEALQRLVQLYEATGRPDQAAAWKQKLAEFDKVEK